MRMRIGTTMMPPPMPNKPPRKPEKTPRKTSKTEVMKSKLAAPTQIRVDDGFDPRPVEDAPATIILRFLITTRNISKYPSQPVIGFGENLRLTVR
jgi:hypothetical protein